VIFFDPEKAKQFPYIRKRGAQLFSKTRFIAAQFMAYFEDGLWLELAAHSNAMADQLRAGLDASPHAHQAWPTRTNEVFAIIEKTTAARLREAGAVFYDWNPPHSSHDLIGENEMLARLVTSWSTEPEDVAKFVALLA